MSVPAALIVCALIIVAFLAVITRILNLKIVVPALVAVLLIVGAGLNIAPALDAAGNVIQNMFGGTP